MNTRLEMNPVNVLPAIQASMAEHKQDPRDPAGPNLVRWYNADDDATKLIIDKVLMMISGQNLPTLARMIEEPNYQHSSGQLNEHQKAAKGRFDRWVQRQSR
jgi:hypothetical protein